MYSSLQLVSLSLHENVHQWIFEEQCGRVMRTLIWELNPGEVQYFLNCLAVMPPGNTKPHFSFSTIGIIVSYLSTSQGCYNDQMKKKCH